MAISLNCPHCHTKKVETANNAWFIIGYLLGASYGSKTIIGCKPCVQSKTIQNMLLTSVIGWWCFPWGIFTPAVLVQNIVALISTGNQEPLRAFLLQNGMFMEDMEIDEDGLSMEDKRVAVTVFYVMHHMVWADGSADEREIEIGADIAARLLGPAVISLEHVRSVLRSETPPEEGQVLESLPPDLQITLMRAALSIAAADGVIEEDEIKEIKNLGRAMMIDPEYLSLLLTELRATVEEAPSLEAIDIRKKAASVLGIPSDAPIGMIRNAFKSLIMESSYEEDTEKKVTRTLELKEAYDVLLKA